MKCLQDAGKTVYLFIGFIYGSYSWATIFDPPDVNLFETQSLNPLIKFLNDFKIGGLLIDSLNMIYYVSKILHNFIIF